MIKLGETDFIVYEKGEHDFGWGTPTPLSELGELPQLLTLPKDYANTRKRKNDRNSPQKEDMDESGIFSQAPGGDGRDGGPGGHSGDPGGTGGAGGRRLGLVPETFLTPRGANSAPGGGPPSASTEQQALGSLPGSAVGTGGATVQESQVQ